MSLKELRRRITSVKSTQKITSAMKMVASAKLRRLQERVLFGNNFLKSLNEIGCSIGKAGHDAEMPNMWLSEHGKYDLIIIFGAEKGLCGGFYNNQLRQANKALEKSPNAHLIVFGTKTIDALKVHSEKILPIKIDLTHPKMYTFLAIAKIIEPLKIKGEVGSIHVIGSSFKNVLVQNPYSKILCPFEFESSDKHTDRTIFEPSADVFLPYFFTQYLAVSLHQCWLETLAGEMASRMTAMDNATRNAKDMISDLSLLYNRSRQAKITTELNEIIAGS
ncbi:MAG: ATP synthase F1 subunit gamma [Proteobacteria bacterium]|nr:ATP synthase F1 subunit gamma [Pseudomonadota bacterium]